MYRGAQCSWLCRETAQTITRRGRSAGDRHAQTLRAAVMGDETG